MFVSGDERSYDGIVDNEQSTNDILADDPTEREKCARKYMESILSERLKQVPDTNGNQCNDSNTQNTTEDAELLIEPTNNDNKGQNEDEEGLFGLMIAAAMRRFPPRLRSLAKMKINTIMYEIEEHQYQMAMEDIQTQSCEDSPCRKDA